MNTIKAFLEQYLGSSVLTGISVLFQVCVIIFLLWYAYTRLIKNTPVEKTVKGILLFLSTVWLTGEVFALLHLRILSGVLKSLIMLILLSFVVIFQPELRRFMARLGNTVSLGPRKSAAVRQNTDALVACLMTAITYWKKHKTGALLVFERAEPLEPVIAGGVMLNARLSPELLINLFFVNTPLHDGAVLIKQNKVVSAGVILPLSTDAGISWKYGTRHRAAIGITESTDALAIVVSEESGDVSLVQGGRIKSYATLTDMPTELTRFLQISRTALPKMSWWEKVRRLTKTGLTGPQKTTEKK